jgi:dethiobiotin synthase
MPKQFFITGTDTGVGKTVVSALLCAVTSALYWKPIQTGAKSETDRCAVMRYAGLPPERTVPETYCFDPPVSPHLAASWAGVHIDLDRLRLRSEWEEKELVVEGAGGVLVPLNDNQYMADLMRGLGLPVLLACRSGLGTINHTLLSLAALRERGVEVHGVVMVGPENEDNRNAIEKYGGVQVLGTLPLLPRVERRQLIQAFAEHFDPGVLDRR